MSQQQQPETITVVVSEMQAIVRHNARLTNVLEWIRFQATLHYIGQAFEPEHMRAIGNLAADALDGRLVDLPDYREAMEQAEERGKELHEQLEAWMEADNEQPAA